VGAKLEGDTLVFADAPVLNQRGEGVALGKWKKDTVSGAKARFEAAQARLKVVQNNVVELEKQLQQAEQQGYLGCAPPGAALSHPPFSVHA
jgi:hypothetical protein